MNPEQIARDALAQAIESAIGQEHNLSVATAEEWRRDWIRRIAMHLARIQWSDITLATQARRKGMAREATLTAAALWLELEKHFAAEAEQEDNDDAGA